MNSYIMKIFVASSAELKEERMELVDLMPAIPFINEKVKLEPITSAKQEESRLLE